ncbi:MAG TPA: TetR/AcrR family transcriptional regulator [Bryobacteraceae bacterium]|nr:TetR/AcrR family transcriptional regulator [Bryobacteraceae bacterium]
MNDTKEKILDAAERIFSEHGYAAASLRAMIADAGVNLAAVHYHFGSKEKLLIEVVRRRVGPINDERLRLLDDCERAAAGGPPELEKVLEAFLAPTMVVFRHPQGPVFVRLMGRMYVDSVLGNLVRNVFSDVVERFTAALHRALPELPRDELLWRMFLGAGVMGQAMLAGREAPGFSEDATLDRLVTFLSAGFRAPVRQPAAKD